jgi:hypothetical protein
MSQITKETVRDIIDDFAAEIKKASSAGAEPKKWTINFRNEKADKIGRDVVSIPLSLLRFRKENGRIASDVSSYEKEHRILREDSAEDQKVLEKFLEDKDPEKTDILIKSLQKEDQQEPAIITCDGFLINGNRRKLALKTLWEKTNNPRFERMRVVVLPGKDEPGAGGPPTNREIEQIENRYQFFKDGKSEYTNFDHALSIRRKLQFMSLEEQLRDDPTYADLNQKEFKNAVKYHTDNFLGPLECVDNYLAWMDREGVYNLVSSKVGGKENRWQAFLDYYNYLYKKLKESGELIKLGIEEKDVNKVETLAFNLIRVREFPRGVGKLHELIRDLPKLLRNEQAKKELFTISLIKGTDSEDTGDASVSAEEADKRWVNKNRTEVIRRVNNANEMHGRKEEQEKPIDLLSAALSKLNNEGMEPSSVGVHDLPEAMNLAQSIRDRADELKREFYQCEKSTHQFLAEHSRARK